MAGSGAAFTRASGALAKVQSLSARLASRIAGSDGASGVAAYDGAGGTLWTSVAGFVTALLGGQVSASLPTRAQMMASNVPAIVTTITTSGYAVPGDGGAARYVRATGPFFDGASFQSVDGAWWQLAVEHVTLSMFGAIGSAPVVIANYSAMPDDTAAIQAALTYCIANGQPLTIGARYYRFTKSLNAGKANPFVSNHFGITGVNKALSRLVVDLSENYPAIDNTNMFGGLVSDLWIETSTTSQHSCVMLYAETVSDGMNLYTMRNTQVNDFGPISQGAVIGYCADQFYFDNSWVNSQSPNALNGAYWGVVCPAGITSKFWAITQQFADGTLLVSNNSSFTCATGPGLFVDGMNQTTITGGYLNVQAGFGFATTGHNLGVLRVRSTPPSLAAGSRLSRVSVTGNRIEDQAANNLPASPTVMVTGSIAANGDMMTSTLTVAGTTKGALAVGNVLIGTGVVTGTVVLAKVSANVWTVSQSQTVASETMSSYYLAPCAVYVDDIIFDSEFRGWYNNIGAIFGGPGTHQNTHADVGAYSNCVCFGNAGSIIGGKWSFDGGGNNVGLFNQASSYAYEIQGRIGPSWPAVFTAIGASAQRIGPNTTLEGGNVLPEWCTMDGRNFGSYSNSPTNYRVALKGETAPITVSGYAAGSGIQTLGTFSTDVHAMLRFSNSSNYLVAPSWEVELLGGFAANLSAGATLQIVLSQALPGGTVTVTLGSLASLPAYGAIKTWVMSCRMVATFGNQVFAYATLTTTGTAPVNDGLAGLALQTAGFDITSSVPFVFSVISSSPTANPLGVFFCGRVV
ncbi:hypothetical protein [Novosphingobium sp.]|uniref:hypothetical protein n=1 Tax=Novosphingobium sp. TaxID=1874826 RepID=UPI003B51CBD2